MNVDERLKKWHHEASNLVFSLSSWYLIQNVMKGSVRRENKDTAFSLAGFLCWMILLSNSNNNYILQNWLHVLIYDLKLVIGPRKSSGRHLLRSWIIGAHSHFPIDFYNLDFFLEPYESPPVGHYKYWFKVKGTSIFHAFFGYCGGFSNTEDIRKKSSINLEWVVANSSSIVHLSLETFTLSGYVLYLLITY